MWRWGGLRTIDRPVTGIDTNHWQLQYSRREQPLAWASLARFFDWFGFWAEAQMSLGRNRDWLLATQTTDPATGYSLVQSIDTNYPWTLRATAGGQLDVPVWLNGTLTGMVEYHYNGKGFNQSEAQNYRQAQNQAQTESSIRFAPVSLGPIGTLRQQYLFSSLSGLPILEKLNVGTSCLYGIDSGLMVWGVAANWALDQQMTVSLNGSKYLVLGGDENLSELANLTQRHQVLLTVSAVF